MSDSTPNQTSMVHGVNAPVLYGASIRDNVGVQGIAAGRIEFDGENCIVITLRHADGTILSTVLNHHTFNRFRDNLARHVDTHNADVRASSFGEHG